MTTYNGDIVAWAGEQARLLRAGRFELLDLEHIAEEIEDVGRSEQRELASRMAMLLAHLLKWRTQPERRCASWEITIRNQRRGVSRRLAKTPSLRPELESAEWLAEVWDDGVAKAAEETGLSSFPPECPWSAAQILDEDWLPD